MEGSGREVMVSNYEFKVRMNNVTIIINMLMPALMTVLGGCRAYPAFLDNGLEEDLVFRSYFDYAEKTRHVLNEPTTPRKHVRLNPSPFIGLKGHEQLSFTQII
jgi:hypothetical protein